MSYVQAGLFIGGHLVKSVAGSTDVTLTTGDAGEADNMVMEFTGAITANINVIVPLQDGRIYWAYNNTTGAFTLTVKGSSGTGVAVPQGAIQRVRSDGTNVIPMNTAMTPAGALATSLTLAEGANLILGTSTGSKIGTATTQKLGFFNAAPIVRPSAVGTATGFAAGTTAVTFHSDDTYTGNVGSTAYTLNGIVAALKNLGLIAS